MELKTHPDPTAGQLERDISQKTRALYRHEFGHQPSKVDCHLVGNKIIVFLEDAVTPIEKLLLEAQSLNLVAQVREFIDKIIMPKLKELVEEISKVSVKHCLFDTEVEAGYAGAIFILENPPEVRRSRSFTRKSK